MSETATVYARLNAVKAEVARVAKTGENAHFGYKFATESDIVDCIRPLCAKHGVALVYHGPQQGSIVITEVPTAKGGAKFLYQMWVDYEVVNCDSPEDRFVVRGYGEAMDQDDKGHNKALTNAHKSVLIRLFDISTGDTADDPDLHGSEDRKPTPARAVTPTNAAKTQAAIDKGKANQDDEATVKFGEALASIRWTLTDFKAELVDFAGIKVPNVIAKPYSQWPEWAKVKARELFDRIRNAPAQEPEPVPAVSGIPEDESIPF
jgi:hypothetical protein